MSFCSICQKICLENSFENTCKHTFHESCLYVYLENSSLCHTCDQDIDRASFYYSLLKKEESKNITANIIENDQIVIQNNSESIVVHPQLFENNDEDSVFQDYINLQTSRRITQANNNLRFFTIFIAIVIIMIIIVLVLNRYKII